MWIIDLIGEIFFHAIGETIVGAFRRARVWRKALDPAVHAATAQQVGEYKAQPRQPRALTLQERNLLFALIDRMPGGREEALVQLRTARHAGLAHAGSHVCFTIEVVDEAPEVPDGVHLVDRKVRTEGDSAGSLQLHFVKGRLALLAWSELPAGRDPYVPSQLPALDRLL
ncbi:hypothetical protein EYE40_05915 [Glaciihabitans arcticus]|uniref:Uncharacterized protein n=1 Tax=Glaciihabitans arcticus TaxID=2668039 RepID=A0A4Q9GQL5_9MICO|nr:hypothetical protein [Glaciihabitans arcticus]TBN56971.1 hypothetical protein EYE40_05915 [Glaciihabitans arcticus]